MSTIGTLKGNYDELENEATAIMLDNPTDESSWHVLNGYSWINDAVTLQKCLDDNKLNYDKIAKVYLLFKTSSGVKMKLKFVCQKDLSRK